VRAVATLVQHREVDRTIVLLHLVWRGSQVRDRAV
jgi:hypothetical protein